MNLSELNNGDKAVIVKVKGHGSFQKRIMEMGFIKGKVVTVIKNAPFRGPIEYNIMGSHVSLRINEAQLIEIITTEEAKSLPKQAFDGIIDDETLKITAINARKKINIALVGNPNCGKTSLFNYASGSKEHVGNYSGVTVEAKEARYQHKDYQFKLVDLPGTYSLTAYTPEELYLRKYIFNEHPDLVINVIDSTNLERNLYLTTQLIDMDIKVIIALNMYDDLEKSGAKFKIETLAKLLGIPIIPTIAPKGKGIPELFDRAIEVYENRDPIVRHIHINYGKEVEKSIAKIQAEIKQDKRIAVKMSPRFLAVKLLEQDKHAIKFVTKHDANKTILKRAYKEIDRIEGILKNNSESVITDAKYGFIKGALRETLKKGKESRRNASTSIDKFLTHSYFGFPIFLLFIFLMFFATFQIGSYPMGWIDSGVSLLNAFMKETLPPGMFNDLITDGIISGCGSVLVFLPNIIILFFFISFMEDTGYMARAAFMMDNLMHKIGLHGRSFIPLIMGFGCNVPAIMATRTIRNQNDRILTMLITPFMSCSARLPVYILFIGAFFPERPTSILLILYGTGILLAIITAHFFNKTLFKTKETPFVMELPPYRMPSAKSTLKHMWDKSGQYLKKVGGIILVAVVIIWALGYFPRDIELSQDYNAEIENLTQSIASELEAQDIPALEEQINTLEFEQKKEMLEKSWLGRIGHFIEPTIKPLGFDWHMGIALLSGAAAKEVVVSTFGVLLQADTDSEESEQRLIHQLRQLKHESGKKKGEVIFTPLVAFSFLMFVLIYFPCIGVVSAIAKESGKWKWALLMVVYTTSLAWVLSFAIYQIGSLF